MAADSRWEVHTKGGPGERSFEITAIRADNEHGKLSYGWFDPDTKRLISHNGGPCSWPIDDQETWDALLAVAANVASRLNKVYIDDVIDELIGETRI